MAGIKGMKGGGGSRPGAGRKPKNESPKIAERKSDDPVPIAATDMLSLLQDVALGRTAATALQVRAAIAAVQYTHTKRSDGGKKEEREEMAKKASAGKFSASAPPKLVAAGGKKL